MKSNVKIPKSKFGDRLRQLAEARGLDQASLAAQLNVSQASVSRYFKGRIPRGEVLAAMGSFFGVNPQDLVAFEGQDRTASASRSVELRIAVGRLERLHESDPPLFDSIARLLEHLQH